MIKTKIAFQITNFFHQQITLKLINQKADISKCDSDSNSDCDSDCENDSLIKENICDMWLWRVTATITRPVTVIFTIKHYICDCDSESVCDGEKKTSIDFFLHQQTH